MEQHSTLNTQHSTLNTQHSTLNNTTTQQHTTTTTTTQQQHSNNNHNTTTTQQQHSNNTPPQLTLLTWGAGAQWPARPDPCGDLAGEAGSQPEPCTERCDEHYFLLWGGAQEPQSGFVDGVGGEGRLWLAFFKEVPQMEVLQLLVFVKVVVAQRQIPMVLVLKTIAAVLRQGGAVLPHSSVGGVVLFLDKVVDVPVAVHVWRCSLSGCRPVLGQG